MLNVNLPPPTLLTPGNAASLGVPNPFPQQLGMRVFTPARLSAQFDNIYQWENHARSVYDGLSLSLNRRLSNELKFSGSYTYSKVIDDASDFDEQPNSPYLLSAERALSANDQRQRFVLSGTFDFPFGEEDEGKKRTGLLTKMFGNIETAPILTIGSGRPINPLTGFDAMRKWPNSLLEFCEACPVFVTKLHSVYQPGVGCDNLNENEREVNIKGCVLTVTGSPSLTVLHIP